MEMAHVHGIGQRDRPWFVRQVRLVLERHRSGIRRAVRSLEELRDAAASRLMFEHAGVIQEQIRGLLWVAESQKLWPLRSVDRDVVAVADANGCRVRVTLELRGGSIRQRLVKRLTGERSKDQAECEVGSDSWIELAGANAELMARLAAADAIGPLGWREPSSAR
jgi:excinuclease UvrABC nuclease subunit